MNTLFALPLSLTLAATAVTGAVISPARLPPDVRLQLSAEIEQARMAQPAAFSAVASVQARLSDLDAHKRGRYASVGPLLKSIGRSALFPMLEAIAFEAPARGKLSESAWTAYRSGLLEAVGVLRDRRAEPVLLAVLDGDERNYQVLRSAAEALGYLGTNAAAAKLVALARTRGPKQMAVLAGMGSCRRLPVAQTLADSLAPHPVDATALLLVKSLSDVGNAWAWNTPGVTAKSEESAVRETAARALVGAFAAYQDPVRQAASNALMVVDAPSTAALIEDARQSASPSTSEALAALTARFEHNPTR